MGYKRALEKERGSYEGSWLRLGARVVRVRLASALGEKKPDDDTGKAGETVK